jgi:uncharacterized membrane protein YhaH (DUF805 family)
LAPQANPNALDLVVRAIRGIVTFRGHSRRTELVYYWIAAEAVPTFAQFTRRRHDANLSGRWTLLLPPTMVLGIYSSAQFVFRNVQTGASTLPDLPLWASLFQIGGILFFLAVIFVIPGTEGANRFGPDPRSIDPEQLRARDQQDDAEGAQDPLLR